MLLPSPCFPLRNIPKNAGTHPPPTCDVITEQSLTPAKANSFMMMLKLNVNKKKGMFEISRHKSRETKTAGDSILY